MKKIVLTNGGFALVSDHRFKMLSKHNWFKHRGRSGGGWYAATNIRCGTAYKMVKMHQLIMKTNKEVDHKNRNGLDNRDSNLREATHSQNRMNIGLFSNNSSGFKGVSWKKSHKKWMAYIRLDRKLICLGHFNSVSDAARAYDKAARNLFGKFALTNKMLGLLK